VLWLGQKDSLFSEGREKLIGRNKMGAEERNENRFATATRAIHILAFYPYFTKEEYQQEWDGIGDREWGEGPV